MIGQISGRLQYYSSPMILLETTAGIAYEIELTINSIVPTLGSPITLFTHLVIREDEHLLYGFFEMQSRDCFRQLIRVSGIGPKIAMALLSTLTVEQLYYAINNNDEATLCLTPGIGKKVAQRMLLELNGKITYLAVHTSLNKMVGANVKAKYRTHDLVEALLGLGFNNKEITPVIQHLNQDNTIADLARAVKEALKLLQKK